MPYPAGNNLSMAGYSKPSIDYTKRAFHKDVAQQILSTATWYNLILGRLEVLAAQHFQFGREDADWLASARCQIMVATIGLGLQPGKMIFRGNPTGAGRYIFEPSCPPRAKPCIQTIEVRKRYRKRLSCNPEGQQIPQNDNYGDSDNPSGYAGQPADSYYNS